MLSLPLLRPRLAALAALWLCSVPAGAQTAEDLIRKGDAADQKRQPAEALQSYLPAAEQDPQNPRLLARVARQYRHLMAGTGNRDEKLRLGRTALDYAQRAAAAGPNDAEAQLSPAISYGKLMPLLPKKEQVSASPRVKASADRALALDPRNDYAWHVLGRWNRVLAEIPPIRRTLAGAIYGGLPKGSLPEAERALQRAIALNPSRLIHHIELGRIYAQMGRAEEARRFINRGLAMPSTEFDDAETKALGRETLAKLR